MSTFQLGKFTVNRVGFGAMQLPGPGVFGPPSDHDQAIAVLKRAVELGVNHIDTAQFYGPDVANALIREALHPYPAEPGTGRARSAPAETTRATGLRPGNPTSCAPTSS